MRHVAHIVYGGTCCYISHSRWRDDVTRRCARSSSCSFINNDPLSARFFGRRGRAPVNGAFWNFAKFLVVGHQSPWLTWLNLLVRVPRECDEIIQSRFVSLDFKAVISEIRRSHWEKKMTGLGDFYLDVDKLFSWLKTCLVNVTKEFSWHDYLFGWTNRWPMQRRDTVETNFLVNWANLALMQQRNSVGTEFLIDWNSFWSTQPEEFNSYSQLNKFFSLCCSQINVSPYFSFLYAHLREEIQFSHK